MNFKRYVEASDTWVDSHYIKGTDTDIITTLPATIYPLAQSVTIGLKGNTTQSGTPTPDNPVMPQGTGDLETVGEKAGQYKIPISSADTTTNIYLGEVQTTRKVRKLVLTGEEKWFLHTDTNIHQFYTNGSGIECLGASSFLSNIAPYGMIPSTRNQYDFGCCGATAGDEVLFQMYGARDTFTNSSVWKAYLQQQYAAGTPVTIWYVLATEETAVVNEPLMKIGDYADSLSGISVTTTAGANTLDVDTTVKPSEVTATFNGWHPVSAAHERDNGAWT